jgi:hypothetical protein
VIFVQLVDVLGE